MAQPPSLMLSHSSSLPPPHPAPTPPFCSLLPFQNLPAQSSTVAGVLSAPQDQGFPYGIILPADQRTSGGNVTGAFLLPFAMRET